MTVAVIQAKIIDVSLSDQTHQQQGDAGNSVSGSYRWVSLKNVVSWELWVWMARYLFQLHWRRGYDPHCPLHRRRQGLPGYWSFQCRRSQSSPASTNSSSNPSAGSSTGSGTHPSLLHRPSSDVVPRVSLSLAHHRVWKWCSARVLHRQWSTSLLQSLQLLLSRWSTLLLRQLLKTLLTPTPRNSWQFFFRFQCRFICCLFLHTTLDSLKIWANRLRRLGFLPFFWWMIFNSTVCVLQRKISEPKKKTMYIPLVLWNRLFNWLNFPFMIL